MQKKATKNNKEAVMRFRCTEKDKAIIEKASELDDRKVSDFIRYHITNHARKILDTYLFPRNAIDQFFDMPDYFLKEYLAYQEFLVNFPKFQKYIKNIDESAKEHFRSEKNFEEAQREEYEREQEAINEDSFYNDIGYHEMCLKHLEEKIKQHKKTIQDLTEKENGTENKSH